MNQLFVFLKLRGLFLNRFLNGWFKLACYRRHTQPALSGKITEVRKTGHILFPLSGSEGREHGFAPTDCAAFSVFSRPGFALPADG